MQTLTSDVRYVYPTPTLSPRATLYTTIIHLRYIVLVLGYMLVLGVPTVLALLGRMVHQIPHESTYKDGYGQFL